MTETPVLRTCECDVDDPEPQRLRRVLGRFATGVTLITTWHEDTPHAMTANAFVSVSLAPALVLVSINAQAATCRFIDSSRAFAVNILSVEQAELARRFAGPHRTLENPFKDVWYRRGRTGSPLVRGVVAWIDCSLWERHNAGDHVLFIGRVRSCAAHDTRNPLFVYAGSLLGLAADAQSDLVPLRG